MAKNIFGDSMKKVDGASLLRSIANKSNNKEEAEKAFTLFVSNFEQKIKLLVEINARNLGYDENVAFEAIQCAFNKVWLYPSFDMNKSRCKDGEKAIIIWLVQIANSQMHQFRRKGVCAQISEEEDLSIIEEASQFIDYHMSDLDPEKKLEYVMAFNKKLSVLDEKHRIIYLTYKAYQISGKKLPRTVLEKLRKRLNITQTTVRVYKREACETLNDLTLLQS